MNSLREALEYIKGYCEKHKKCPGCKLYCEEADAQGMSGCVLQYEVPPCDWTILTEKE